MFKNIAKKCRCISHVIQMESLKNLNIQNQELRKKYDDFLDKHIFRTAELSKILPLDKKQYKEYRKIIQKLLKNTISLQQGIKEVSIKVIPDLEDEEKITVSTSSLIEDYQYTIDKLKSQLLLTNSGFEQYKILENKEKELHAIKGPNVYH